MITERKFINLKGLILSVLLSCLSVVIAFAAMIPVSGLGLYASSIIGTAIPAAIGGIIYVLITVKSPYIGTYFIYSFVFGLFYIISGSITTAVLFWIAGIIGEITMIGGRDKNWRPLVPYLIHWMFFAYASIVQMVFMRETTIKTFMGMGMDEAAAISTLEAAMVIYTDPVYLIVSGVCIAGGAILGYFIGVKTLRKHFKAAGIA